MPEINLHGIRKGFDPAQIPSIVYGNKSIEDNSPSDLSNISAWLLYPGAQPVTKFKVGISPTVNQEYREATVNGWTENEDPFTQSNLVDIEDNQVQQLIFQIRRSTFIPNNARLANRLTTLFHDAKEEDSTSPGIRVDSLRNFYFFLLLNNDLKYPNITLTPDNNIYISWEGEQDRLFSVHFLPNGITNFVIFKPNDRHPEQTIRLSGIATSDILMETVSPHGVNEWISE